MSAKADKYIPKRVRSVMNQVTSQMEYTVLDAPQLALERIVSAIDANALPLSQGDYGRLMDKLAGRLAMMFNHTDADLEPADVKDRLILVLSRRNAVMSETITRMCSERKG